jgi:hypothetical protein
MRLQNLFLKAFAFVGMVYFFGEIVPTLTG